MKKIIKAADDELRDIIVDKLYDLFENSISEEDAVAAYNEFASQIGEDQIHTMDELDDVLSSWSPSDIVWQIAGSDFNVNDDYFVVTDTEDIHSFTNLSDTYSPFDISSLVEYIVDENEDFGIAEISEILASGEELS